MEVFTKLHPIAFYVFRNNYAKTYLSEINMTTHQFIFEALLNAFVGFHVGRVSLCVSNYCL